MSKGQVFWMMCNNCNAPNDVDLFIEGRENKDFQTKNRVREYFKGKKLECYHCDTETRMDYCEILTDEELC